MAGYQPSDRIGEGRNTVSKRHQSSRRKSYGRRQHEVRERAERRREPGESQAAWDERAESAAIDAFGFLDAPSPVLRLALGE